MITGAGLRRFMIAVLATIAVAGFAALGVWQLLWMQWQDQVVEQAAQVAGSEPVTITDIEAGLEYGYDVNLLRVRLNGFYRHDLERYIKSSRNGEAGYQVITPFIDDSGYTVLVDRGWVQEADRLPASRSDPRRPEGKISITGITRANPASMVWSYPAPDRQNNIWSWFDRYTIAGSLPAGTGEVDGKAAIIAALFVQVEPDGEPGEGQLPQIFELQVASSFNHALAAAASFLLALGLAVFTIRMFWRRNNKARAG